MWFPSLQSSVADGSAPRGTPRERVAGKQATVVNEKFHAGDYLVAFDP